MICALITPGLLDYAAGIALQESLVAARKSDACPDTLILLEHTPVITLTRSSTQGMLRVPSCELARRGVQVHSVSRGGQITYHGPGQLVGYPILDLSDRKTRISSGMEYVEKLEQVMLDAAASLGVPAYRRRDADPKTGRRYVGVWVDVAGVPHKLGAAGARIFRENGKWVTMHGFAFNVQQRCLEGFSLIDPCGFRALPVISLEQLVGTSLSMSTLISCVAKNFARVFEYGALQAPNETHINMIAGGFSSCRRKS